MLKLKEVIKICLIHAIRGFQWATTTFILIKPSCNKEFVSVMLFHLHWKLEVCPDQLLTTHFVTTHVPPPQISQVIFAIKIPFLNASLHFHFPVFSPFLDILDKVLCLSFYDLPYLLAADTAFFPPFTGSESISLS